MNCDTARVLLQFARPPDLDSAERDELARHLDRCAECRRRADQEKRIDSWLGPAMGAVAIPIGLRERILGRLANERNAYYRGWLFRGAVAAAVVALAVTGFFWIWGERKGSDQLDPVALAMPFTNDLPSSPAETARWIHGKGIAFEFPPEFALNWRFGALDLVHADVSVRNEVAIPTLVYKTKDGDSRATVLFLPRGKYQIDRLPGQTATGGVYGQVRVVGDPARDAYVALVVVGKGNLAHFLNGSGVST